MKFGFLQSYPEAQQEEIKNEPAAAEEDLNQEEESQDTEEKSEVKEEVKEEVQQEVKEEVKQEGDEQAAEGFDNQEMKDETPDVKEESEDPEADQKEGITPMCKYWQMEVDVLLKCRSNHDM